MSRCGWAWCECVCVAGHWIQQYLWGRSKASVYRLRGTREVDIRRPLVSVYLVPSKPCGPGPPRLISNIYTFWIHVYKLSYGIHTRRTWQTFLIIITDYNTSSSKAFALSKFFFKMEDGKFSPEFLQLLYSSNALDKYQIIYKNVNIQVGKRAHVRMGNKIVSVNCAILYYKS